MNSYYRTKYPTEKTTRHGARPRHGARRGEEGTPSTSACAGVKHVRDVRALVHVASYECIVVRYVTLSITKLKVFHTVRTIYIIKIGRAEQLLKH